MARLAELAELGTWAFAVGDIATKLKPQASRVLATRLRLAGKGFISSGTVAIELNNSEKKYLRIKNRAASNGDELPSPAARLKLSNNQVVNYCLTSSLFSSWAPALAALCLALCSFFILLPALACFSPLA